MFLLCGNGRLSGGGGTGGSGGAAAAGTELLFRGFGRTGPTSDAVSAALRASTAAAKVVIEMLQAAQGPPDPDAPPPEKPKYLRPQDKGGRPGDGTVPSGGGGSANGSQHPRTLLQELVHAFPGLGELRYDQLEDAGLNQPGRYLVGVTLGGQLLATARGRNKKDASTAAAAQALVICQSRVAGMERQQTYAPAPIVPAAAAAAAAAATRAPATE